MCDQKLDSCEGLEWGYTLTEWSCPTVSPPSWLKYNWCQQITTMTTANNNALIQIWDDNTIQRVIFKLLVLDTLLLSSSHCVNKIIDHTSHSVTVAKVGTSDPACRKWMKGRLWHTCTYTVEPHLTDNPHSGYPQYNGHFWKPWPFLSRLQYIRKPWIANIPLLCIKSFHFPNYIYTYRQLIVDVHFLFIFKPLGCLPLKCLLRTPACINDGHVSYYHCS